MQNQPTASPMEKSSLSRRHILTGFATGAAMAAMPAHATAGADELSFMIDNFREVRAQRISLKARLDALEAERPSTVVHAAEMKPTGWFSFSDEYYLYEEAKQQFANAMASEFFSAKTKERYAQSWEVAEALFFERKEKFERWDAETGYSLLVVEEEETFDREAGMLIAIVERPCSTFLEARVLAEFVVSDIPDDTYHSQHTSALRSISGVGV